VFALSYLLLFYFLLNRVSRLPLRRNQRIPRSISLLIYGSFAFILARNSFGLKPLGVADALVVKDPIAAQLTLNSPFVVLKTIQNKALPPTHFLPENIEKQYVNPHLNLSSSGQEARYNLMFIIVESLGNKQLFQTVHGCRLTPFMDSLANHQANRLWSHGLAEGKTSIECLPAMFAGIPSLLETPYILSNFSTNQLTGFPRVCNEKGYATYFVHGATRGSMRFDAMANALGFQEQWYRNELASRPSDLGSWGVHDHAVFKQLTKKIPKIKQPFMMTVFTLSTHEPYDIPISVQRNYPMLSKEERTYRFIDDQLRLFFSKNSRKSWFKNTVFVITGDHTPVHLDNAQYQISDYYSVPILVSIPNGFKGSLAVREQQDLVPALCSAMQWKTELYSYYNPKDADVIRYLNGIYYIWNDAYELQFNEATKTWRIRLKKLKKASDTDKKVLYLNVEASKAKFLSLLQRFRRDLRLNKTHR
jgi:phosphoglycerol transferase MdoB-like AlkP superfamily enzyme